MHISVLARMRDLLKGHELFIFFQGLYWEGFEPYNNPGFWKCHDNSFSGFRPFTLYKSGEIFAF